MMELQIDGGEQEEACDACFGAGVPNSLHQIDPPMKLMGPIVSSAHFHDLVVWMARSLVLEMELRLKERVQLDAVCDPFERDARTRRGAEVVADRPKRVSPP